MLQSRILFQEEMKKSQTGYMTFCGINIVTLPPGKLWRVFVFPPAESHAGDEEILKMLEEIAFTL